jgi:putative ABC transport system ATP-binding protein
MSLIVAKAISKTYRIGDLSVEAIKNVDLTVEPGSFVAVVGPSGSGKSTLLNLIGSLDRPTSGHLEVAGEDVTHLDRGMAAAFRGDNIGFVFQDFNLLPVLSAYENIEYPLIMVQNWKAEARRNRVWELLEAVDILEQADKRPDQLSGGQKQRVAVARALVSNPKLVLADEPTANLDSGTAKRIIELMRRMRDDFGTTFVFSTHDPRVMATAETTYRLCDGILEDGPLEVEAGGGDFGAGGNDG